MAFLLFFEIIGACTGGYKAIETQRPRRNQQPAIAPVKASTDANSTRFRPPCLARYRAMSAAWMSESASLGPVFEATPRLTVT